MSQLTRLTKIAIQGAIDVAKGFRSPHDDWTPILLMETDEGEATAVSVSRFFLSDESKIVFGEKVLPQLIETFGAQEVVIVNSAWMLELEQLEEDGLRPRDSPERVEVVIVTSVTAVYGSRMCIAPVSRDPRGETPPKLGDFSKAGVAEDENLTSAALRTLRARRSA